jgi:hypothetical protein
VHQKPPHQTKQVLKDPMQFSKFRYGRVDKVTYWVNHPLSQGVFPGGPLSKSCGEYDMDGGKNFGHGVHDIQGIVVSHLWVPL